MRVLAIETATAACSVALIEGGRVIHETHEVVGRGHAERLVPMIAALPGHHEAEAILVDCGPGSFTGVRVGLAAARALGFGWSVPVRGYSSLALLAAAKFAEPAAPVQLTVALAGGHGELFVQRFTGPALAEATALASLPPADAAALAGNDEVIGSGAATLLAARGDDRGTDRLPRAAEARRLPPAFTSLPPRPIYGRAPDAKVAR